MKVQLPSDAPEANLRINRILRLPEVRSRTGLSRSSLYERMHEKTFPSSISLGGRNVGWLESEIDAWIDNRVKESRHVQ